MLVLMSRQQLLLEDLSLLVPQLLAQQLAPRVPVLLVVLLHLLVLKLLLLVPRGMQMQSQGTLLLVP